MAQLNPAAPSAASNPIFVGLARIIDAASSALHAISRYRATAPVAVAVAFAGIVAVGQQGALRGDFRVYDTELSRISTSTGSRFVRVTGRLDTARPYQTRLDLGPLELRGGQWVRLVALDGADQLWVARETLPANAGGTLTLVGRLTFGSGQEPPIYLDVGSPPDIEAHNRLAMIGGIAAVLVLAGYLMTFLARRADFAPRLPAFSSATAVDAPAYLWFGDLVPGWASSAARNAPIRIATSRTEARLSGDNWETAIRHPLSISSVTVATRFGALPAIRIVFQDERGLVRRAVLAARSTASRNQLAHALSYIGR